MENFLNKYRAELNFNGVHMYDFFDGSDCMGRFAQPLNGGQIIKVQSLIDGAHANELKAIFMRSNLPDLCRCQRLVYEVTQPPGNHNTNYGFCYNTTAGKFETETDGTTSIHACVSPVSCNIEEEFDAVPQYICRDVYENLQHTDLPYFQLTEQGNWYLKPRMKIRQQDFSPTDDRPVVTIEVIPFDGGAPIASKVIRIRNFKNNNQEYDGNYIDLFNFSDEPSGTNLEVPGNMSNGLCRGWTEIDYETNCRVDFRIKWEGNVDVWFDKLTVDDNRANILFAHGYDDYIDGELLNFGGSGSNKMDMFFCDEIVNANIEACKYVLNYVRNSAYPDTRITIAGTNGLNVFNMRNNNWIYQPFLENVHPDYFQVDVHRFYGWRDLDDHEYHDNYFPDNITPTDPKVPADYHPAGWKATKTEYNSSLQTYYMGDKTANFGDEGTFIYQVRLARDQINQYSPGTRFIMQPQIQSWIKETQINGQYDGYYDEGNREPTDQEYEMQAMLSLAHGAESLCWFWFNSFSFEVLPNTDSPVNHLVKVNKPLTERPYKEWYHGLINEDATHRTSNMWGQNKWQDIGNTNAKILSWKPTLDLIDWFAGYSLHSEGSSHGCIGDIKSIYRNPSTLIFGPVDDIKYWELGLFEESQPNLNYEKYFMMVNRRCIPETAPGEGDIRQLKIKFNPDILRNYTNWTLTELENNTSITFDKNNQGTDGFLDIGNSVSSMGYFNPGEGKLFKLVPVIVNGGILVADENISGESFNCNATVYNNGFDITIGANTTIHFNDSSKFVMDGGVFTVGDQNTSAPQNITSDAVPGGSWLGHKFTNCEVKIYGATFSGLANDTTYAVNIIDCPVVDIRNCTFNTNSSLKGGLNVVCFNNPFIAINNIYIGSNTFTSSGSTIPTVNVSSYAGVSTPLIIENNIFNEGNTAVFLSGVIGGAIKGNTITDNYIGINALTSSIDVVQNNISSTVNGSMGIFAAGGSELKLNSSGSFTLGGLNSISNDGTGTNNINVDGSYFLLDDGENIFNISSDQSSYHLYGYFPMFTAVTTEETNNCFKVNSSSVDPPVNIVTSGYQGSQITFNFIPYLAGCEIPDGGDGLVINLGNGIYDTIYTGGSGSGGSKSSVESELRSDKQTYVVPTAKEKYDSVCVLMRYRNYTQTKTKCLDLINTYPDSIQSMFAVSKLFLSTVASDTTYNAANNLKIFYQNLILNHPGNTSLVKRANYYILKCKVRMREYSQALLGFQQIINLNPYSYEGLIARWDYMATSLLIQGQGGGEPSITNYELGITNNNQSDEFDKFEELGDDRSPFTKEQRKDIRKSINTAIDVSKNNDETKMKTLEEKSELGDVNASKELTQMKSLKQVVKTEKPKSITQHIKIVSEDIRKVFGTNTSSKGNQPKNLPTVFRLSQNYPNPFNPVTKINYDLPKDSKVNIVIYDILGREVKRLVNNELKTAGSYIVDFNAMNYASGVYFYRIEAEEPNGSKFVDSKKMVLLK